MGTSRYFRIVKRILFYSLLVGVLFMPAAKTQAAMGDMTDSFSDNPNLFNTGDVQNYLIWRSDTTLGVNLSNTYVIYAPTQAARTLNLKFYNYYVELHEDGAGNAEKEYNQDGHGSTYSMCNGNNAYMKVTVTGPGVSRDLTTADNDVLCTASEGADIPINIPASSFYKDEGLGKYYATVTVTLKEPTEDVSDYHKTKAVFNYLLHVTDPAAVVSYDGNDTNPPIAVKRSTGGQNAGTTMYFPFGPGCTATAPQPGKTISIYDMDNGNTDKKYGGTKAVYIKIYKDGNAMNLYNNPEVILSSAVTVQYSEGNTKIYPAVGSGATYKITITLQPGSTYGLELSGASIHDNNFIQVGLPSPAIYGDPDACPFSANPQISLSVNGVNMLSADGGSRNSDGTLQEQDTEVHPGDTVTWYHNIAVTGSVAAGKIKYGYWAQPYDDAAHWASSDRDSYRNTAAWSNGNGAQSTTKVIPSNATTGQRWCMLTPVRPATSDNLGGFKDSGIVCAKVVNYTATSYNSLYINGVNRMEDEAGDAVNVGTWYGDPFNAWIGIVDVLPGDKVSWKHNAKVTSGTAPAEHMRYGSWIDGRFMNPSLWPSGYIYPSDPNRWTNSTALSAGGWASGHWSPYRGDDTSGAIDITVLPYDSQWCTLTAVRPSNTAIANSHQDSAVLCARLHYLYELTPTVTTSAWGIHGGQTTFNYSVDNSRDWYTRDTQWTIGEVIIQPEVVISNASYYNGGIGGSGCGKFDTDGAALGIRCTVVRTGSTAFVGDGTISSDVVNLNYDPGTKVCRFLTLDSYNEQNQPNPRTSNLSCTTIVNSPYTSINGGSVWAGGSTESPYTGSAGMKAAEPNPTALRPFGSTGEYGIFATGTITHFGSAGQLNTNDATGMFDGSRLTFANKTTPLGNFNTVHKITNLKAQYDPATHTAAVLDAGNKVVNSGVYKATGDVTITGMTGKPKAVIYAPDNMVTITDNIVYDTTGVSVFGELPSLTIIAKDIRISGNVTEIAGNFYALNQFVTCGEGPRSSGGDMSAITTIGVCSKQLTINGAVTVVNNAANSLVLNRSYGGDDIDKAAEIVRMRPEVFLTKYEENVSSLLLSTASETELPARY